MSHVLLDCTTSHALATAKAWGWKPHEADHSKVINRKGEAVTVCSSASRAEQMITAADKLYLGERWQFAHGYSTGLVEGHQSRGGAVFKDGKN